jgi:hypothetical protein
MPRVVASVLRPGFRFFQKHDTTREFFGIYTADGLFSLEKLIFRQTASVVRGPEIKLVSGGLLMRLGE